MTSGTIALVLLSAVIHAGWNLLIRSHNLSGQMMRVPIVAGIVGLGPLLWWEWKDEPLSAVVWWLLLLTGFFQAIYYLGLAMGYQTGDFTVVYPLVRALPVLFVALFDLARHHAPTGLAWIGLALVTFGCLLIPHASWRAIQWQSYRSRTLLWVILAASGTVGYSAVDKIAAELMVPGPVAAARYFLLELIFCIVPFGLALRLLGKPLGIQPWRSGWRWSFLAALGTFFSYWLILWAYQSATHASYVVAMRQLSIVIGAVVGTVLFNESARGLRLPAALMITTGVILVAIG